MPESEPAPEHDPGPGIWCRALWHALAYGAGCGLLIAAVSCMTLFGPTRAADAVPGERAWSMLLACGSAAIAVIALMTALARRPGSRWLPAAFFHVYHVYLGRLAALLALLHAGGLIALEPRLLADLRPSAPSSLLAGTGALVVMMVLAALPTREGRVIHERRPRRAMHALLAGLAAALALVHVMVKDYHGIDQRHWIIAVLAGGTMLAPVWRVLSRRRPRAAAGAVYSAATLKSLVRGAVLMTVLPIGLSLLLYGTSG